MLAPSTTTAAYIHVNNLMLSTTGNGNKGLIGDCGYIDVPVGGCLTSDGEDMCNGRGVCSNSTARTCQCYEGFSGLTCELRDCPLVSLPKLHSLPFFASHCDLVDHTANAVLHTAHIKFAHY
jgi:hypothetical protein